MINLLKYMHSLINPIYKNNYLMINKNINMLTMTPDNYLCTSIILETASTICLRNVNYNKLWYIPSYIGYGISFYLFPKSLIKYKISTAYQIWCGFGIILTTLIDFLFFNKILKTKNIVGILVMIIGIKLAK